MPATMPDEEEQSGHSFSRFLSIRRPGSDNKLSIKSKKDQADGYSRDYLSGPACNEN